MSDLKATVQATSNGFAVRGIEQINYGEYPKFLPSTSVDHVCIDFRFVDDIFNLHKNDLADVYQPWKRVLLVTDSTVNGFYSTRWEAYFKHHGIKLTTFVMAGGEKNKTMATMLSIVDAMDNFGIVRKEPVLVVGGGYVWLCSKSLASPNCPLCTGSVPTSQAMLAPLTGVLRTSFAYPPL